MFYVSTVLTTLLNIFLLYLGFVNFIYLNTVHVVLA
jgi:hypothetical protein